MLDVEDEALLLICWGFAVWDGSSRYIQQRFLFPYSTSGPIKEHWKGMHACYPLDTIP